MTSISMPEAALPSFPGKAHQALLRKKLESARGDLDAASQPTSGSFSTPTIMLSEGSSSVTSGNARRSTRTASFSDGTWSQKRSASIDRAGSCTPTAPAPIAGMTQDGASAIDA
jgi:hypothetical protein